MSLVRVAAAQFYVDDDLNANLERCLSAVDDAAAGKAQLLVLPEFCNHLSWYQDKKHCWSVSLDLNGPWLNAIAEKAKEYGMYIVVNVTLRRGDDVK